MQGETAEIVPPPRLRLVGKKPGLGMRKVFYKECSYNLTVNYQDLATSDMKDDQGFTSDTEVVWDYFDNEMKKLAEVYDGSKQPVKIVLPSHTGLKGRTEKVIRYSECRFIPDHDFRVMRTEDMHEDLGFESDQEVRFDINEDRKKVPAKVLGIEGDPVRLILPARARATVGSRVEAGIGNLQLMTLNLTPGRDNSDGALDPPSASTLTLEAGQEPTSTLTPKPRVQRSPQMKEEFKKYCQSGRQGWSYQEAVLHYIKSNMISEIPDAVQEPALMALIQVTLNLRLCEVALDRLKELTTSLKGEMRMRVEERLLTRLSGQEQAPSVDNVGTSDTIVVQHPTAATYTGPQNGEEFRTYCRAQVDGRSYQASFHHYIQNTPATIMPINVRKCAMAMLVTITTDSR